MGRKSNGEGSIYFVEKEQKWRAEIEKLAFQAESERIFAIGEYQVKIHKLAFYY
jgi:hypothetical protein